MSHPFDAFQKQQYLNIETFRKNGQGVKTPVWFCQEGEVLYVSTGAVSGKVKRVRNNPSVRVAPCNARGDVRGVWLDATVEILPPSEEKKINDLLNKKYGLIKFLFELFSGAGKQERALLKIQVA